MDIKTNWVQSDEVMPADMNRIEGNINALNQSKEPAQTPMSPQEAIDGTSTDTRSVNAVNLHDAATARINAMAAPRIRTTPGAANLNTWIQNVGTLHYGESTGAENAPDAGWNRYIGMSHINSAAFQSQLAFGISSPDMFVRSAQNNVWSAWHRIWNSASLPVESGTWWPNFVGSATAGEITHTSRTGVFYRIGRMVFVYGQIVIAAGGVTAAPTGNIHIGSLPFVVGGGAIGASLYGVFGANYPGITPGSIMQGIATINTNTIAIFHNSSGALTNVLPSNITSASQIVLSFAGQYLTA